MNSGFAHFLSLSYKFPFPPYSHNLEFPEGLSLIVLNIRKGREWQVLSGSNLNYRVMRHRSYLN